MQVVCCLSFIGVGLQWLSIVYHSLASAAPRLALLGNKESMERSSFEMMTLFMRFRCSGSGPPLSLQKCVTYLMHVVSVGMVSIGSHSGTKMATHVAGKFLSYWIGVGLQ